MRFATLRPEGAFATVSAVHDGEQWRAMAAHDLSTWLASPHRDALTEHALAAGDVVVGTFANPVPRPGKVICCGLNYADHIRETGRDLPMHPTLFTKFADSLVGDGDDVVVRGSEFVDWEAELVVVVGRTLTRASVDEARDAIAGYTAANDISMRDWQRRTLQWFQGKAWDASTPVGPILVTPDELDPAAGVEIRCFVNDEQVQGDNTSQLVFGAAELLAYVSSFTTLRAGDVVLTGTPGGVGMGMSPQRSLASGDEVRTEIDGIGVLRNRIVLDPRPPTEHP